MMCLDTTYLLKIENNTTRPKFLNVWKVLWNLNLYWNMCLDDFYKFVNNTVGPTFFQQNAQMPAINVIQTCTNIRFFFFFDNSIIIVGEWWFKF